MKTNPGETTADPAGWPPDTAGPASRWSRQSLLDLGFGVLRAVLLQQGVVLGLFRELRAPVDAAQLAAEHGWPVADCRLLLDTYAAMGLVRADGDLYQLSLVGGSLDEEAPASVAHNIRHLWAQRCLWNDLPRVLAASEPLPDQQDHSMQVDRKRMVTLLKTMRRIASQVDSYVAAMPEWDACADVLDVAGGHGELLAVIAERRPGLRGIVIDQPYAREEAEATFTSYGLSSRLSFLARDLTADDPLAGLEADGILLARCLHNFSPERIRLILRNCREALRPGGFIATIQSYLGEDGGAMVPASSAIFSAYMSVNCLGGHVPPAEWMIAEFKGLGADVTVDRFSETFAAYLARW